MTKKDLKNYAKLILKQGINLQKGELLAISAPVEAKELVDEVAKYAYKLGASEILMLWSDDVLTRLSYENRSIESLSHIPDWSVEQREYILDKKGTILFILSDDPELLVGIDSKKISTARRASGKAFAKFRESTGSSKTRWCIASYPNVAWAKKMFPTLTKKQAMDKLWEYIKITMRLDGGDALERWKAHQENIERRCKVLNDAKIKSFHYKNSLGTDFVIGMPDKYQFLGGAERGVLDGVMFTANMPTEEVFSSPDKYTANGTLVSSMPLVRNGSIIEDFSITFKDGRVVDFSAKKGYENLKSIIETDDNSCYLGEIALVGCNSPINNLQTLFYETLFDENASCHFALGDSYPSCYVGGEFLNKEELEKVHLNSSIEHVDFMVGTSDLTITAILESGEEMKIFENGDWVI